MIQEIQTVGSIAGASDTQGLAPSGATPSGFGRILDGLEAQSSAVQAEVQSFMEGKSTVSVAELMVSVEKNRLMLSLALQLRNKLVEGLQELYRTPI